MSFAMILSWKFNDQAHFEAAGGLDALRNDVIPTVQAAPGFIRGAWTLTEDNLESLDFVEVASKEAAEAGVAHVKENSGFPGPILNWVKVYEIVATA